jgi:hypothetical protein
MIYLEHYPTNHLNLFIEKIWYCSAENLTTTTLTIPLPNHELVLNFSESYEIKKAGDKHFAIENPKAWINGLQSRPYYSYSTWRHEMLGVLFKANSLNAFFKHPSSEFTEAFIDARLVFGNSIETLIQQVQHTCFVASKIKLVEDFLLAGCIRFQSPDYLTYSIKRLSDSLQPNGISGICSKLSVTNKSLIQAFKKHVGVSPVKYSHLHAINTAISLLANAPGQSLTALAYRLNFYDQPHFIKFFKSITSLTPSQYVVQLTNKRVDVLSPNFISMEG